MAAIFALRHYIMIEKYTIKFGPAVSQKELERLLHEETAPREARVASQDEGADRVF
jgi:hypothetical protein